MPGGDKTGPLGMGPMTGRAAGFCAEFGMPGYMNPVPGRGFGMGLGRGRGFGGGGHRLAALVPSHRPAGVDAFRIWRAFTLPVRRSARRRSDARGGKKFPNGPGRGAAKPD